MWNGSPRSISSPRRSCGRGRTRNRKDLGLNWNQTLEAGGILVGEVKISIDVELIQSA